MRMPSNQQPCGLFAKKLPDRLRRREPKAVRGYVSDHPIPHIMKSTLPPIAESIAQGGRTGTVETVDSGFKIQLIAPPDSGGGQGLTPEHLFGAAWAACFHGALLHCSKQNGLAAQGSTVTARVQLQPDGEKPFEVELLVSLPGLAEDKARHVIALAHEMCAYSRATRGRVGVKISLN